MTGEHRRVFADARAAVTFAPREGRSAGAEVDPSHRIHLSKADIGPTEEAFVLDAIRSGWVAPLGPHVDAFEAEVAARVGVSGAVALSSGTAALHLALLGVGVGPGDHVVCSSMTFAASANAIVYTGAHPVFIDSDRRDGNVDPQLLLDAIDTLQREGRRVGAALIVDLFGRCADYDAIVDGLVDRGVPLIEDAAEALGATHAGRPAGSFGAAAALSFNGNKIMTTSGGGMLLSHDRHLLERARHLSTQARLPVPWYEHAEDGYNYRLSNLLAALGRGQLSRLDTMITRRRTIRRRYAAELGSLPGIGLLGDEHASPTEDNCWLTAITVDPAEAGLAAADLISALERGGIEARHLWKPMHLQPAFTAARSFLNGHSAALFATGVALPSGSSLDDQDIDRVIDVVGSVLNAGA